MSANVQVVTLKRGEGAYRVAAVSGLLTTVAAATATAGHLWSMRWAPPVVPAGFPNPRFCVIQRLRARRFTISGFTAAQECGMDLSTLRTYTVAQTGGTAMVFTGANQKKNTSGGASALMPSSAMADMRIGAAGALTAGTHALDAQPIAAAVSSELAAGATVQPGAAEIFLSTDDLDRYPLVLAANEGLVIRNTVLMGAGGTTRLVVEIDWLELQRY